jgi:hypothetical protein
MPYRIVGYKGQYAVENMDTGRKHGWTTLEKAKRQMRLLVRLTG